MKLVGVPDGTDHNKVVEALSSTSAEVCGVDFLPNHTAHVLLHNDAKSVLGELENGKVTIDDVSVEASVLEGEEEKEALKKVEDRMNSDDDSDDDYDEDEAGDDSDQSPEDEAGDDSDLSYEEEASDDSDPSSEDQSTTPDAENVMQEPSAVTGEKRQGSSEPGNPAKKARDDWKTAPNWKTEIPHFFLLYYSLIFFCLSFHECEFATSCVAEKIIFFSIISRVDRWRIDWIWKYLFLIFLIGAKERIENTWAWP